MNRNTRILAVFAACIGALLLALVPIGTPGPSKSGLVASLTGPGEAEAAIDAMVISIPFGLLAEDNMVLVEGAVDCTAGELLRVGIVITQVFTGVTATGEGQTLTRCTGDLLSWEVKAPKRSSVGFVTGPATLQMEARTFDGGHLTSEEVSTGKVWLGELRVID
jgi:hypothetical protein